MSRAVLVLLVTCALASADEATTIAELVAALGDPSFARREAAQAALAELGEPALPALRAALASDDPERRQRARALVTAIEARVRLARLAGADLVERRRALAELVLAHQPLAVIATLEQQDPAIRAWALTEILYVETEVELRTAATNALLRMHAPEARVGLAWAARDTLGHLQTTVEAELARPGPPIPPVDEAAIRAAVAAGTPADRVRAIRMVVTGLANDPLAIEVVAAVLADPLPELRRQAAWAFRFLAPARAGTALIERTRTDTDRAVRIEACLALSRLPEPAVRAALVELASGEDAELARVAASALGDVGDATTERALMLLRDRTGDVALRRALDTSLERIRARLADPRR